MEKLKLTSYIGKLLMSNNYSFVKTRLKRHIIGKCVVDRYFLKLLKNVLIFQRSIWTCLSKI